MEVQAEVTENVQIFPGYKVRWSLFSRAMGEWKREISVIRMGALRGKRVTTQLCSCDLFSGAVCVVEMYTTLSAHVKLRPLGPVIASLRALNALG